MKKLMLGFLICSSTWVQAQSSQENIESTQNDFEFSLSKINFGLHTSFYKAGNEIESNDINTETDTTSMQLGQGLEIGIPYSEYLEYRLGIRNIPFEASVDSPKDEDKLMLSLEMINTFEVLPIYFVSGVNYIDNGDIPLSVNLGAGFRYHLSESLFAYLESKLYINAGGTSDFAINLGMVYQFSSTANTVFKSIDTETAIGERVQPIIVERARVIESESSDFETSVDVNAEELAPEKEQYGILATIGAAFVGIFDVIIDVFSFAEQSEPVIADDVTPDSIPQDVEVTGNESKATNVVINPFSACLADNELLSGKEFLLYFAESEEVPSIDNNLRLDCVAKVMAQRLDTLIHIDGYVSLNDEPMQRMHLSYTRALNTQAYLIKIHGIAATRIRITRHDKMDDFNASSALENQGDRRVGYRLEVVK